MEAKNKKIVIGAVVVLAIIVGVYLYNKKKEKPKTNTEPKSTEVKSDSDAGVVTTEVAQKKTTASQPIATVEKENTSVDILAEVMKNTLGKGSSKKTPKGVAYVELVINDPLKNPFTWKFFNNQKFEVFDKSNTLIFRGSFRNGGLRLMIGTDNYQYGTADITGMTINGKNIQEIANNMFTLKK